MAESKSAALSPKCYALRGPDFLNFLFGASRLRCGKAAPFDSASSSGVAGFEPTHGGVKVRCLTAWLHPIGFARSPRSTGFSLHRPSPDTSSPGAGGAVSVQSYAATCSPGFCGVSMIESQASKAGSNLSHARIKPKNDRARCNRFRRSRSFAHAQAIRKRRRGRRRLPNEVPKCPRLSARH
jgi:hypothetical protein